MGGGLDALLAAVAVIPRITRTLDANEGAG
jgi:hypothetical protein